MTTMNLENVREELCVFLRNSNVLSTSVRGVTTASQNVTATAGQTVITLSNLPVRNVRSLTVNAGPLKLFTDYSIVYNTGVITLVAPLVLNDAVVISYDYGSGDKIYPDLPRVDLTITSYPRIGLQAVSVATRELGLGGMSHLSDGIISAIVWAPANKDSNIAGGIGGTHDLNDLITSIRTLVRAGAKGFVSFPYISPTSVGPLIPSEDKKIIQLSIDFMIKFIVE